MLDTGRRRSRVCTYMRRYVHTLTYVRNYVRRGVFVNCWGRGGCFRIACSVRVVVDRDATQVRQSDGWMLDAERLAAKTDGRLGAHVS